MGLRKWVRLSVFNLLIVAALGVVLRYKIAFYFPFIDQKWLLHSHSHFAFSGWITQALMALMVSRLSVIMGKDLFKRYSFVLWANLICSYGMLISFLLQGYAFCSITFSTLALFVSYVFAVFIWKDIKRSGQKNILFPWFKAATFFNAFSSVGAFSLAYMMATHQLHQSWYLAAVYFFLHFQYNGWFSFTILGLISEKFAKLKVPYSRLVIIFRLFAVACIPAYFLSALWLPIPIVVYIMVVMAAVLQVIGWGWILRIARAKSQQLKKELSSIPYFIFLLSFVAFSIKFLLQLGSTIPSLSTFAFGFRPIIIGYLHLVLLGITSLFILGYSLHKKVIPINTACKIGLCVFISGIILNELVLMIQGIAAMNYVPVAYVNEFLFGIALVLFSGVFILNVSSWKAAALKADDREFPVVKPFNPK
jgi:hypothetical protein